jgi:hypothetical protein
MIEFARAKINLKEKYTRETLLELSGMNRSNIKSK